MELTYAFLESSGRLGPSATGPVSPVHKINPPLELICLSDGQNEGGLVFRNGDMVRAVKCYDHSAAGDFKYTVRLEGIDGWWKSNWFLVKQN